MHRTDRSLLDVLRWVSVAVMLVGCIGASRDRPLDPATDQRRELRVAVAANLRFAFDACREAFERSHRDIELTVTYGSSGSFYAQLQQRAPFDLFLSADTKYATALVDDRLADPDAYFAYARGQLAIWAGRQSMEELEQHGLDALTNPSVKKIAIANPRIAPYGSAAQTALQSLGLYRQIESKLVFGDNVSQAANFVESGAAQLGVIALSLAMAPEMQSSGYHLPVPPTSYEPIEQAGVVTRWCSDREAADALRNFLTGPEGQQILVRFGYLPPADAT